MKCYYCHHRKGDCFLRIERMAVILCESCANRRLTMLNLSRKFQRSETACSQPPREAFKIEELSSPS